MNKDLRATDAWAGTVLEICYVAHMGSADARYRRHCRERDSVEVMVDRILEINTFLTS